MNLNAFRLKGLKERPFKLRLSIITGDRPVLVLRIIQLEAVQEEMANEFRDLLVEKFKDSKVETFIGSFWPVLEGIPATEMFNVIPLAPGYAYGMFMETLQRSYRN